MKPGTPQLVVQLDAVGEHNRKGKLTRIRLEKSAAWKKQRVVCVIPAGPQISAKVVLTWLNMATPPNNGRTFVLAQGAEVGAAYSGAIEWIVNHPELSQWEYILTLEHDNMPPWDGVLRLVEDMEAHPEFSCIGGLYYTKGAGGHPQIWGDPKDPVLNFRPQVPIPNTVQECCGTGMGFNLWRMSMFKDKKLRKPWFVTETKKGLGTQDLYFWGDARKRGYKCAVDTGILVGHYDIEGDKVW